MSQTDADADVHASDLTQFQTDILAILAEEARYGLAIKRQLEAYCGEEVNHGRLYPNLDDLVDDGLVDKSELDKRTNQYELTQDGWEVINARAAWLTERLGGEAHRQANAEPFSAPSDAPRNANDDPVFGGGK